MVKDPQVKELRRWLQQEATLSLAALKTGMDRQMARKYGRGELPSESAWEHDWATRPDAFADVWAEVASRLELAPGARRPATARRPAPRRRALLRLLGYYGLMRQSHPHSPPRSS